MFCPRWSRVSSEAQCGAATTRDPAARRGLGRGLPGPSTWWARLPRVGLRCGCVCHPGGSQRCWPWCAWIWRWLRSGGQQGRRGPRPRWVSCWPGLLGPGGQCPPELCCGAQGQAQRARNAHGSRRAPELRADCVQSAWKVTVPLTSAALYFTEGPGRFVCAQSSRGRGKGAVCPVLGAHLRLAGLQLVGCGAGQALQVGERTAFLVTSPLGESCPRAPGWWYPGPWGEFRHALGTWSRLEKGLGDGWGLSRVRF